MAEANRVIDVVDPFHDPHALPADTLQLRSGRLVHVAYLLESQARMAAYAADLAETAINHKVATAEALDA